MAFRPRAESTPPAIAGSRSNAHSVFSAVMNPSQDRLYTVFDEINDRHGLFKVETIGDAYMTVGNIREEGASNDHCYRIALFALEAVAAAQTVSVLEDDPSMGYLSIRAGFHAGPVRPCYLTDVCGLAKEACERCADGERHCFSVPQVVASVVGRATPRFCLFGDTVSSPADSPPLMARPLRLYPPADQSCHESSSRPPRVPPPPLASQVNTASRMESNSLRNSITISPEAAELLRKQAPHMAPQIVPRGLVEVKGKGLLELYLLKASGAGRQGGADGLAAAAKLLAPPDTIVEDAEVSPVQRSPARTASEASAQAPVWVDEALAAHSK